MNRLELLPGDILNKIYEEKHKLELKEAKDKLKEAEDKHILELKEAKESKNKIIEELHDTIHGLKTALWDNDLDFCMSCDKWKCTDEIFSCKCNDEGRQYYCEACIDDILDKCNICDEYFCGICAGIENEDICICCEDRHENY